MNQNTDTAATRRRFGGLTGRAATAATATGLVLGGFTGAFVVSHAASAAATPSSSGSTATGGPPAAATFHSNENPAHEATESPQREAQENAGQMPTVP